MASTSAGEMESVLPTSLRAAALAVTRMAGSAEVVTCCKRRLKCCFQCSRHTVVLRLLLSSFNQKCLDEWASKLKTYLMLLFLAMDSRCLAFACQNSSLSLAIATLCWRFNWQYSIRSS